MLRVANRRRFADDARGSVAVVAAVCLFVLIMGAGMAVDYACLIRERAELQAAADAAAIAGAKEIPLAFSDLQQVELVASNYAKANLGLGTDQPTKSESSDDGGASSKSAPMMMMMSDSLMASDDTLSTGSGGSGSSSTSVNAAVIEDDNAVEVTIAKPWTPYFAGFLPIKSGTIEVTARAQVMGTGKICVLGLMESSLFAGVHLDNNASISAPSCGVYSNSTSFASIRADAAASAEAEMFCAAGGYWAQSGSSFTPAPTTDCPPIPDPLADRPTPIGWKLLGARSGHRSGHNSVAGHLLRRDHDLRQFEGHAATWCLHHQGWPLAG